MAFGMAKGAGGLWERFRLDVFILQKKAHMCTHIQLRLYTTAHVF